MQHAIAFDGLPYLPISMMPNVDEAELETHLNQSHGVQTECGPISYSHDVTNILWFRGYVYFVILLLIKQGFWQLDNTRSQTEVGLILQQ